MSIDENEYCFGWQEEMKECYGILFSENCPEDLKGLRQEFIEIVLSCSYTYYENPKLIEQHKHLCERNADFLLNRFGLKEPFTQPIPTLKALGEKYNVTGQTVLRTESKAMRMLQHPVRRRAFKEILDSIKSPNPMAYPRSECHKFSLNRLNYLAKLQELSENPTTRKKFIRNKDKLIITGKDRLYDVLKSVPLDDRYLPKDLLDYFFKLNITSYGQFLEISCYEFLCVYKLTAEKFKKVVDVFSSLSLKPIKLPRKYNLTVEEKDQLSKIIKQNNLFIP